MGRSIYANEVGSSLNDNWVHKMWLGVQSSMDIESYIKAEEVTTVEAELDIDQEADIKSKMDSFKREFKKRYNLSYKDFMKVFSGSFDIQTEREYEAKYEGIFDLGARINLGEHLLQTIKNMKVKKVQVQYLDIEL